MQQKGETIEPREAQSPTPEWMISESRQASAATLSCHLRRSKKHQKVKEKSEKVGLKLNIRRTKIMASGPITSWEIDGETVETVSDFILGGSKITADGNCSYELKRRLPLEGKL